MKILTIIPCYAQDYPEPEAIMDAALHKAKILYYNITKNYSK